MAHLVRDDTGELRLVGELRHDAGVDGDLSAGEAERVHLVALQNRELPFKARVARGILDRRADPREERLLRRIGRWLRLRLVFAVRRGSHLPLARIRREHQLRAPGNRNGAAASRNDREHGRNRKDYYVRPHDTILLQARP